MTAAIDPAAASVFPATIGDTNPENAPPAEVVQLSPEQQRIAALEAQLKQQGEENAAREQRYLQSMDSLMARGAAPAEPAAPAPVAFSLDDLPDAIQAPTEFKTKLAGKVNEFVAGQMQSAQQSLMGQMTRAQALDGMWNRMSANPANAEYVKRTALLQGAAAVTFNDLRARGIDPVAVAAQNPDSLIGSIITRMQAELGTAAPGNAAAPASGARASTVAGGSVGAGPAPIVTAKPPSFVEQHKAYQKALGLI